MQKEGIKPNLTKSLTPSTHLSADTNLTNTTKTTSANSNTILPADFVARKHLTLEDFGSAYGLASAVVKKLTDNGYSRTQSFKYILISKLSEILMGGEIAEFRCSVDMWVTDQSHTKIYLFDYSFTVQCLVYK